MKNPDYSRNWREACRHLSKDQCMIEYDNNGNLKLIKEAEKLFTMRPYEVRQMEKKKMDTTKYANDNGNFLKAEDMGKDFEGVFTVDKENCLTEKTFDNGIKLVVSGILDKNPATLVLNQTNLRRIQEMYGMDSDDWEGKKITLVTEYVPYQGKDVLAIRVKK